MIEREQAAAVGYYLHSTDLGDLKRATHAALEAKIPQGDRDVIRAIHKKVRQANA